MPTSRRQSTAKRVLSYNGRTPSSARRTTGIDGRRPISPSRRHRVPPYWRPRSAILPLGKGGGEAGSPMVSSAAAATSSTPSAQSQPQFRDDGMGKRREAGRGLRKEGDPVGTTAAGSTQTIMLIVSCRRRAGLARASGDPILPDLKGRQASRRHADVDAPYAPKRRDAHDASISPTPTRRPLHSPAARRRSSRGMRVARRTGDGDGGGNGRGGRADDGGGDDSGGRNDGPSRPSCSRRRTGVLTPAAQAATDNGRVATASDDGTTRLPRCGASAGAGGGSSMSSRARRRDSRERRLRTLGGGEPSAAG